MGAPGRPHGSVAAVMERPDGSLPAKVYAAEDERLARSLIRQVLCEIRGAWAPFGDAKSDICRTIDPRQHLRTAATLALGRLDDAPVSDCPKAPEALYGLRKAHSDGSTFAGWMRSACNWYDLARATTFVRRRPRLDAALAVMAHEYVSHLALLEDRRQTDLARKHGLDPNRPIKRRIAAVAYEAAAKRFILGETGYALAAELGVKPSTFYRAMADRGVQSASTRGRRRRSCP